MKQQSYSNTWELFFTPKAIIPFVIGTLMMGVAGNALYTFITNLIGTSNKASIGILLGSILILILAVMMFKQVADLFRSAPTQMDKEKPAAHKGLILLVSNEELCRKSIDWHIIALTQCWLFYSVKTKDIADKLEADLLEKNVSVDRVFINDVFDPSECLHKIDTLYNKLPAHLVETDVILDFTGMTTCSSVGSVLACLNVNRHKQYTPGEYNKELRAMQPLDPIEIKLHWGGVRKTNQAGSTRTLQQKLPDQSGI